MATKNLGKESIVISGKLQISRPTGGHAQEAWRRVGMLELKGGHARYACRHVLVNSKCSIPYPHDEQGSVLKAMEG